MAWAKSRVLLIGAGAVVVIAIASSVAVAHAAFRHHHRDEVFIGREYLGGPMGPGRGMGPGWFRGGPGPMGGSPDSMGGGPGYPGVGAFGALHGELTVPTPNGKYQTVDVQRGTVTQLGSGSLTVRSADGFTKTYSTSATAVRGVSKGDQVQLRATVSGSKATVLTLADLSNIRGVRGGVYPAP